MNQKEVLHHFWIFKNHDTKMGTDTVQHVKDGEDPSGQASMLQNSS